MRFIIAWNYGSHACYVYSFSKRDVVISRQEMKVAEAIKLIRRGLNQDRSMFSIPVPDRDANVYSSPSLPPITTETAVAMYRQCERWNEKNPPEDTLNQGELF